MKRLLFLAALLLTMAAPAHAQLNIRKVGAAPKQMAVLQMKWNYLYSIGEDIYFVTSTTNQFDDNIWIRLGGSLEEAYLSVKQLLDTIDEISADDVFQLDEKDGEELYLRLFVEFGKPYGLTVSGVKYAGNGYIYTAALKKAVQTIQKERTMQDLERRKKEQQNK